MPWLTFLGINMLVMLLRASAFPTILKTHRPRKSWLARKMSSAAQETVESFPTKTKVRVLALHGSEGTGLEFSVRLYPLREELFAGNVDMQIHAISAPFRRGHGYVWWTMEPGVRSFNAEEYIGFEESASLVIDAMSAASPPDLVFGHSQGAILVAAILAQNLITTHPRLGYILNGIAWPNPYGQQLFNLRINQGSDEHVKSKPRVLFVMGQEDSINPLDSAKKVRDCLDQGGFQVTTHTHTGGHAVPNDEESTQAMAKWVLQDEL